MKNYKYQGYEIHPKRDFSGNGYFINGKFVKKGWIVSDGICNVMPGATWFQTVKEAKHGIEVLIKCGEKGFWEGLLGKEYYKSKTVIVK